MTRIEWKLKKAKLKMRQKRDTLLKGRIKKAAVIGGVILAAVISIGAVAKSEKPAEEVIYTVKNGDTLWNITEEHLRADGRKQ